MSNNMNVKRSTMDIITERVEVVDKLKQILIHRLNLDCSPDEITHDAILFGSGIGLDSIDALQLISTIESEFEVTLPQDQSAILRSVNTIADFIIDVRHKEKTFSGVFIEEHADSSLLEKDTPYYAIRNEIACINYNDLAIYRIQLVERSLEKLNQFLSNKITKLTENNMQQSLILDNNSPYLRILAYVELYHCGDHLLLLINNENKHIITEFYPEAIEESEQYDLFSIEGPKSHSVISQIIGTNAIGLKLHMHVLSEVDSYYLRTAHLSRTGETGFLFFSSKIYTSSLLQKIEAIIEHKLIRVDDKTQRLLQMESCEIGFDLSLIIPNHECPFSAGLNWMIDLSKYPNSKYHTDKKLILIRGQKGDMNHCVNDKLFIDNQMIGYISACDFSLVLQKIIGYAYVDSSCAFPGVITDDNIQFVSAPFVLAKSLKTVGE